MSAQQIVDMLTQLNARLDSLRTYENTLIQIMKDRNSQAEIEYSKVNARAGRVMDSASLRHSSLDTRGDGCGLHARATSSYVAESAISLH